MLHQKLTKTKIHAVRAGYGVAMWQHQESSVWEKFSLEPTLESWWRTRWLNVRRHNNASYNTVLSILCEHNPQRHTCCQY